MKHRFAGESCNENAAPIRVKGRRPEVVPSLEQELEIEHHARIMSKEEEAALMKKIERRIDRPVNRFDPDEAEGLSAEELEEIRRRREERREQVGRQHVIRARSNMEFTRTAKLMTERKAVVMS